MDWSEEEHFFNCPFCLESISMLLDLSSGGAHYVEDCEVCCRPIQISFQVEEGQLSEFTAEKAQD